MQKSDERNFFEINLGNRLNHNVLSERKSGSL